MSGQDQAQYILGLPLAQYKAIKKAIGILTRAGMTREEALSHLIQAHSDSKASKNGYAR